MEIQVEGLWKAYDGKPVLTGLTAVFPVGITCVAAPSGTGKTTLLRLLLGLERSDAGVIRGGDCRWAAVFQEDRLLEHLDARRREFTLCPGRAASGDAGDAG